MERGNNMEKRREDGAANRLTSDAPDRTMRPISSGGHATIVPRKHGNVPSYVGTSHASKARIPGVKGCEKSQRKAGCGR